jgi:hypothetical protein
LTPISANYNPPSNGVVERKNKTLLDMARTITLQNLNSKFKFKFDLILAWFEFLGNY